jgi:cbb3-type cytochrome oxidase subunit 3
MIKEAFAQFPHIWLTCLGLLIFLSVFIAVLIRVFRHSHRELYKNLSELPLQEEGHR